MKLEKDIARIIVGLALGGFVVLLIHLGAPKPEIKPEYEIELVDQDTILIHPLDQDGVYVVHPDNLINFLEEDNL